MPLGTGSTGFRTCRWPCTPRGRTNGGPGPGRSISARPLPRTWRPRLCIPMGLHRGGWASLRACTVSFTAGRVVSGFTPLGKWLWSRVSLGEWCCRAAGLKRGLCWATRCRLRWRPLVWRDPPFYFRGFGRMPKVGLAPYFGTSAGGAGGFGPSYRSRRVRVGPLGAVRAPGPPPRASTTLKGNSRVRERRRSPFGLRRPTGMRLGPYLGSFRASDVQTSWVRSAGMPVPGRCTSWGGMMRRRCSPRGAGKEPGPPVVIGKALPYRPVAGRGESPPPSHSYTASRHGRLRERVKALPRPSSPWQSGVGPVSRYPRLIGEPAPAGDLLILPWASLVRAQLTRGQPLGTRSLSPRPMSPRGPPRLIAACWTSSGTCSWPRRPGPRRRASGPAGAKHGDAVPTETGPLPSEKSSGGRRREG